MLHKAFCGLIFILAFANVSSAQEVVRIPQDDRAVVHSSPINQAAEVPDWVDVAEDGTIHLYLRPTADGRIPAESADRPSSVPACRLYADGTRTLGLTLENSTNLSIPTLSAEWIQRIDLSDDGHTWLVRRGERRLGSHRLSPPGRTVHLRATEHCPVQFFEPTLSPSKPVAQNRQIGTTFFFDMFNAYPPGVAVATIQSAIQRAIDRINLLLLIRNSYDLVINVQFAPVAPDPQGLHYPLLETDSAASLFTWNFVQAAYFTMPDNPVDAAENGIYDWSPSGTVYGITGFNYGQNPPLPIVTQFTSIAVPEALTSRWLGNGGSVQATVFVWWDPTGVRPFDFDSTNGVPATAFDFEGAFLHELFHAHGFEARGDPQSANLRVMDFMRLPSALGPTIDAGTFFGANRAFY